MRKRRWWIAGLTLTLLAACMFWWKWSERPPYAFMEGDQLYFVEDWDYRNPRPVVTYTSSRSFAEVRKRAIGELGRPSVDSKDRLKFGNVSVVPADKWDVNSTTDSAYPALPKGAQTVIRISREATNADTVRANSFRMSYAGGTPL
ncbi:MAG: hypothetical protein IT363_14505 [Methanoregulaceae archaeon]|nr:hypothetical protein [Methanoregulaceae archaeon]